MAKTVKEVVSKSYPVRVNVNGKYSHKFNLPKPTEFDHSPRTKKASPLDVARKKGSKI